MNVFVVCSQRSLRRYNGVLLSVFFVLSARDHCDSCVLSVTDLCHGPENSYSLWLLFVVRDFCDGPGECNCVCLLCVFRVLFDGPEGFY